VRCCPFRCLKISILFLLLATFSFLASNPKTTDGMSQHKLSSAHRDGRWSTIYLFSAGNLSLLARGWCQLRTSEAQRTQHEPFYPCFKNVIVLVVYVLSFRAIPTWTKHGLTHWRTQGGGLGGSTPPPPRSFEKAGPNSQFCGIYICNNIIRIWVSFIYKLSETPN
jgi:hypothetical protein